MGVAQNIMNRRWGYPPEAYPAALRVLAEPSGAIRLLAPVYVLFIRL